MTEVAETQIPKYIKPLLRGHFHQGAFFFALGACAMLIASSHTMTAAVAFTIYSLGIVGLFGTSALYHRPHWQPGAKSIMKRLDHAMIFVMIAGTGTPICLLAIADSGGHQMLLIVWAAAVFGVLQSLFWAKAPKWLSAVLYVAMGWLAAPYIPEIKSALGIASVVLLLVGGIIYTVGAVVYATKRPNPWPKVFGYHEIFHVLTIFAATLHFIVIAGLQR